MGEIFPQGNRKSGDPVWGEYPPNLPSAKVVEGDNVFEYAKGILERHIKNKYQFSEAHLIPVEEREWRPAGTLTLRWGGGDREANIIEGGVRPANIAL